MRKKMKFGVKISLRKAAFLVVGIILMLLIGLLERHTKPGLPFSILFYLIPVCVAAWYSGFWQGFLIAGLSIITRFYSETRVDIFHLSNFDFLLEIAVRLVFFIFIVFLLAKLRLLLDREKKMARTDYLTGLANRRYFMEISELEISRSGRFNKVFTLAYIDVDNFKKINDVFGHHKGDEVLQRIAATIERNIRIIDTACRLGGDEFAILLPETGREGAKKFLGKIIEELKLSMNFIPFRSTFSVGAVTFVTIPPGVEAMLKKADALMYEVKKSGKNGIKFRTTG
jgi:diguanylate cyclase (GGDEF)-like protein